MLEALKITHDTYGIYLRMPLREHEQHLDFEGANGHYIVKDPANILNWRCISKAYFDDYYVFALGEGHPTRFRTLVDIINFVSPS